MARPSIFVTDDDQVYLQLIRDLLTDVGYARVIWHAGDGAFHRVRDEQPDLVLLDINMMYPGRGWSTLNALSLHPKTRHIPVILCSTEMRLIHEKAGLLRKKGLSNAGETFRFPNVAGQNRHSHWSAAFVVITVTRRTIRLKIVYTTSSAAAQVLDILFAARLKPRYDFELHPVLSTTPPMIFTVDPALLDGLVDQIRAIPDTTVDGTAS